MTAKPGSAQWKRQYREVIVGINSTTKEVRRIYVQNDGGMSGGSLHYPSGGRAPEHEAVVVFGLSKVRSFPVFSQQAIDDYAETLRQEAASEQQQGDGSAS